MKGEGWQSLFFRQVFLFLHDDTCNDCDQFIRFLFQFDEAAGREEFGFLHQVKPVGTFPGLFLGNAVFVYEISRTLRRLRFRHIRPNRRG